ncbi:uncharacterized protein LOC118754693 [Rhagoletis pomonella]|uniref:uncharacterized protein LOC118754693 n=1 Tax=Rhagoletis pomonella TaxID=28610 RepID=UPI00177F2288|nr:uncharacterized protein LOC118754693 [Rhagoletis pomonella]
MSINENDTLLQPTSTGHTSLDNSTLAAQISYGALPDNGAVTAHLATARSIKLPSFWKENPSLWFAQVEAALDISQVRSDAAQFKYVLVHLDETVLPFIADIVLSPPAEDKYKAIKKRIIDSFAESEESRLRRILRGVDRLDEKPTSFLQRLRNLSGGKVPNCLLRTLFLEQLPENARCFLACSTTEDLDDLAMQANKICDVQYNIMTLNRTSDVEATLKEQAPSNNDITQCKADIQALVKKFEKFTKSAKHGDADYCYFHKRFGVKARNCRKPCTFLPSSSNLN